MVSRDSRVKRKTYQSIGQQKCLSIFVIQGTLKRNTKYCGHPFPSPRHLKYSCTFPLHIYARNDAQKFLFQNTHLLSCANCPMSSYKHIYEIRTDICVKWLQSVHTTIYAVTVCAQTHFDPLFSTLEGREVFRQHQCRRRNWPLFSCQKSGGLA